MGGGHRLDRGLEESLRFLGRLDDRHREGSRNVRLMTRIWDNRKNIAVAFTISVDLRNFMTIGMKAILMTGVWCPRDIK